MPVDDAEFTLISPKFDNSGKKIRTQEIEEIATRMSERFGGVTIQPTVLGCWKPDDGPLKCEENVALSSVRDSAGDVPVEDDEQWMREMAADVGDEFGQHSVMVTHDVVESQFVDGEFRPELEDEKVGRKPFDELI